MVVAPAWIQHDLDVSPLFPRYEVPLYGKARFHCDPVLSALLFEASCNALAHESLARQGYADACVHQGLIASGWHTCCIAMRLMADHVLQGSESFASPGIDKLQWLEPVRPGDSLMLRVLVNQVRRSQSRPNLGIVEWRWTIERQHQRPALHMDVTSMFLLGPAMQAPA